MLRQKGKKGQLWDETRELWLDTNPPDSGGFYYCYIPWCGKPLVREPRPDEPYYEPVTLDHKESRTRRPDLFADLTNLFPCCSFHNKDKGSLSLDEYIELRSP